MLGELVVLRTKGASKKEIAKYKAWGKRMKTDKAFRQGWEALEEFINDHRVRGWVPVDGGGWRRYLPGLDGPDRGGC